ncbi:MAG: hypothetical protein ACYS8L_03605 [Planctomycetota bacterium]|jgi:hypothetical protein
MRGRDAAEMDAELSRHSWSATRMQHEEETFFIFDRRQESARHSTPFVEGT